MYRGFLKIYKSVCGTISNILYQQICTKPDNPSVQKCADVAFRKQVPSTKLRMPDTKTLYATKFQKEFTKHLTNKPTLLPEEESKKVNTRYYTTCGANMQDACNIGRHMYHEDCELAINQQILAELNAAYAYLSMAAYFGRADIALPGCYGFFMSMHQEEMEHAILFLQYQNMRGGRVKLCPITSSACTEWDVQKALEVALEMEKLVKEKLIEAHDVAEKHHDLNLMDMVVTDFIGEQERSINEFCRLLSRYKSMKGCGNCSCVEYLFDKEIHETFIRRMKVEHKNPKDSLYK